MPVLNNQWVSPVACMVVLFMAGCVNPAPRAEERAITEERARVRTEQQRVRIPSEPAYLQQYYVYPPYGARQSFRWTPHDNMWQLTFVDRETVYTGLRVRRPIELPPQREGMELYLELQPPKSARSLAIGLTDGSVNDPALIPVVPLSQHRVRRRGDRDFHAYSVPLHAFESRAVRITPDGTLEATEQRLDWDAIQGIHLRWLDHRSEIPRQMIIMNLQVAPSTWTRGLQIGEDP